MDFYLPEICVGLGAGVFAPETLNIGVGAFWGGSVLGFVLVLVFALRIGLFLTGVGLKFLGSYFLFFW